MAQCLAVETEHIGKAAEGQRPLTVQGLLPPLELPSRETGSKTWPVPVLGPRRRRAHESYLPILSYRRPADDVEERSTETQAAAIDSPGAAATTGAAQQGNWFQNLAGTQPGPAPTASS
jgi:hypothetical protein